MKPMGSMEELAENPEKYGAPTFEEFQRNQGKYMGRDDDVMSSVSEGGHNIRGITKKHVYEIEGYTCKSLEEVERVASSQGIPLRELDYRPILIPDSGLKCDIRVKFMRRNEIEKRGEWK